MSTPGDSRPMDERLLALCNRLANAQSSSTGGDEFLLALYNKLWENINNKEIRLWTFLSIYGAAVGLALGAGAFVGRNLYAAVLVSVLTLWAIFILINAEWWSHRNRLMVQQIERRMPESQTTGIVPAAYWVPRFRIEALTRQSLWLLTLVALAIYLLTMLSGDASPTRADFAGLTALYLLWVFGSLSAVSEVEARLREYYSISGMLDDSFQKYAASHPDRPDARGKERPKYTELEQDDRRLLGSRFALLILQLVAFAVFLFRSWLSLKGHVSVGSALLIVGASVCAVVQWALLLVSSIHYTRAELGEREDVKKRWSLRPARRGGLAVLSVGLVWLAVGGALGSSGPRSAGTIEQQLLELERTAGDLRAEALRVRDEHLRLQVEDATLKKVALELSPRFLQVEKQLVAVESSLGRLKQDVAESKSAAGSPGVAERLDTLDQRLVAIESRLK